MTIGKFNSDEKICICPLLVWVSVGNSLQINSFKEILQKGTTTIIWAPDCLSPDGSTF